MTRLWREAVVVVTLVWLSGCGSLLPSERAEVQSPFIDYLDAEMRYSQAVNGMTSRSELFSLGFDPLTQGNGKMLSFIDVRLMFVQPNIPINYLPDGLVRCLEAKDRCVGYAFEFTKTDTQRVAMASSHKSDTITPYSQFSRDSLFRLPNSRADVVTG